jgi:ubiquinone/menaquinone biosynthesis C-methylase UbiE
VRDTLTTLQTRRAEITHGATVRAQAAARTAFYGAASMAAWSVGLPFTAVERDYFRHALGDAYDFHVRLLARPGMREVLRRLEREDLVTLPALLATIPLDVLRAARKLRRGEPALPVTPPDDFPYPDYYLTDFHHQKNGNLSFQSALTYEWQIRFLFQCASRLMRQAVVDDVPEGEGLDILDVGCGTADWVRQARLQNRRHRVTGIDLSPQYLSFARLLRGEGASFRQMDAAALAPEWSGRFDHVTCIWLFHELPPDVSDQVTAEIARALKPGGRLSFLDAAQPDDVPEGRDTVEAISEHFSAHFNEPYFRLYQQIDLPRRFAAHGLDVERVERWYTSKLITARKRA